MNPHRSAADVPEESPPPAPPQPKGAYIGLQTKCPLCTSENGLSPPHACFGGGKLHVENAITKETKKKFECTDPTVHMHQACSRCGYYWVAYATPEATEVREKTEASPMPWVVPALVVACAVAATILSLDLCFRASNHMDFTLAWVTGVVVGMFYTLIARWRDVFGSKEEK